jgi:tetratricopeptide (TPR) repeat protein
MAMVNLGVLEQGQGHIEKARSWYFKAIASDHADQAPRAMVNLGVLEKEQGHIEKARDWYVKAVASGHAKSARRAQDRLDALERSEDDLQRAENFAKYGAPFIDADFDHPTVAETIDTREDESK